ncbi:MAG: hypothetical protein Q8Q52_02460 [Acidimicrobiia bacterium]|nr:hypothetical protein [Acidimicrobiia bacterium]
MLTYGHGMNTYGGTRFGQGKSVLVAGSLVVLALGGGRGSSYR